MTPYEIRIRRNIAHAEDYLLIYRFGTSEYWWWRKYRKRQFRMLIAHQYARFMNAS